MTNWRKIEKRVNERWVLIHKENIKKGDKIRMFDSDGEIVSLIDGITEFKVVTDAKKGDKMVEVEINTNDQL